MPARDQDVSTPRVPRPNSLWACLPCALSERGSAGWMAGREYRASILGLQPAALFCPGSQLGAFPGLRLPSLLACSLQLVACSFFSARGSKLLLDIPPPLSILAPTSGGAAMARCHAFRILHHEPSTIQLQSHQHRITGPEHIPAATITRFGNRLRIRGTAASRGATRGPRVPCCARGRPATYV